MKGDGSKVVLEVESQKDVSILKIPKDYCSKPNDSGNSGWQ